MIYSIDFDGTIVEDKYPETGKPIQKTIDFIKQLQENKIKWILNTIREKETLKTALDFLKENGLTPDYINANTPQNIKKIGFDSRKILADVYIDNRNAGGLVLPSSIKNQIGAKMEKKLILAAAETVKGEFSGVAYAGNVFNQEWAEVPLVIDLQGAETPAEVPLMYDHEYALSNRLGVAKLINTGAEIKIEGVCDAESEIAAFVRNECKKHDFQLSIGTDKINDADLERCKNGAEINGRKYEGELIIIRKCQIREVSVVALGADKDTCMKIVAALKEPEKPAEQENKEEAKFNATDKTFTVTPEEKKTMAENETKINDLEKQVSELKAKLDALPKVNLAANSGNAPEESKVKRAALLRNCGMSENKLVAKFGEKVVEAAAKDKTASVQKMVIEAAVKAGFNQHSLNAGNIREALKLAFSTADITNIITATANDILLDTADAIDQSWREIAHIIPATNFQPLNRVRLDADVLYDEVKRGGEIKHGSLADEAKPIQVKQFARMLVITQQDIVDDSLGAFAQLARDFANAGLETLNIEFWKEFEKANFFTGDSAFAGSALSFDALTAATAAFRKRKNAAGRIIADKPSILLVPSALEMTAEGLFRDTLIASGAVGKSNTFNGKYKPVCAPYLTSDTAYYLLTAPARRAAMGVAFLNGVETPVVESTDADFDTLGIKMRGVFNFGVAQEDRRAGIKVSVN